MADPVRALGPRHAGQRRHHARLLVTPVLLPSILAADGSSWPALVALDRAGRAPTALDGYLARRQGTTRSGAFLDPLADKFLVLGAMVGLVATDVFWWVPVALIAVREIGDQRLPVAGGRRGISVPARQWAKVKTVVQDVAVGVALRPDRSTAPPGSHLDVLWVAVGAHRSSRASQYLADGPASRSAPCGVRSSPSAPSCSSARSSTPTRPGSASGWPLAGIDSHFQTKVGDNHGPHRRRPAHRRSSASDAVIVCGGLGPTQDDITREAIAEVMGVALVRDEAVLARIRAMFSGRGPDDAGRATRRQADVPEGAAVIEQARGTAPG